MTVSSHIADRAGETYAKADVAMVDTYREAHVRLNRGNRAV